jgi:hypothetical protein
MKGRGSLLRQPPETRSPSSMPPLFAKAAPAAMVTAGAGGAGTLTGARRAPYSEHLTRFRSIERRRGKRSVGLRRGL